MGTIRHDLRHACRTLRRNAAFTLAATLTLALGIGANTAIFSVVESVLLRPLPYQNPSKLVQMWNTYPPLLPQAPNSVGDFRDFRERSQTFSEMAAYIDTPRGLNLTGEGEPERLEMRYMTAGLLATLGIKPVAGRGFTSAEDQPGAPFTVLISYRVWQQQFGSNPAVVGRTLTLDGLGYTLAGVLPEDFRLDPKTDVWLPIGQYNAGPDAYRYHECTIIARLKPGIRIEQAQAELNTLNYQQQKTFPDTHKNFGVLVTPLEDAAARRMRSALLILLGAVGLVLLVACANFVNLLMARNAARQRELAARAALGATRLRLVSQLVTESVLLSLLGGVCGIALAFVGLRVIDALLPPDLTGVNAAGLNYVVLAFTVALSLASGIGCGLIPALQTARLNVNGMLKGMRATCAPARQATRRMLVVSEIAVAIILLTGAGLLIRSFERLMQADPGFRPYHTFALEVDRPQPSPAEQRKWTTEQWTAYLRQQSIEYEALIERIQALPGVEAAGGISVLPLGTAMRSASRFVVEGQPVPPGGARPVAETRSVSPGYFAAMGIPLRQGRLLDEHDYGSQNAIVNQAFADRFWPDGNAIGKRYNLCSLEPEHPCWFTIIGVIGNVHQYGLEAAPTFDSYGPAGWEPFTVVRTASDPVSIARAVIGEIHKFNSSLPVTHVMTLDTLLSESVDSRRLSTFLLGLFAGLALLLATIGVYAVMSYAVRLRANEIGVRVALGAQPRNIWWLIISSGARIVLTGIAIGMAGALALTKLLSTLLYGVTATDPITFGGVALLLACVALVACYLPARQAMQIDPVAALRLD